jgi:hypothetical protein
MSEPMKFIGVTDLFKDLGEGIGVANRSLVSQSVSAFNTLIVKSVDVNVSFEMTSHADAQRSGLSGDFPLLGAKTISYTSESSSSTTTNKCNVSLHIVSISPGDPPAVQQDPGKQDSGGIVGGTPSSPFAGIPDKELGRFIGALRARLKNAGLPVETAGAIAKGLEAAQAKTSKGDFAGARAGLDKLVSKHAGLFSA